MSLTFDTSTVRAKLERLRDVEKLTKHALYEYGAELLHDASFDEPRPPVFTGTLRGSGAIVVNGEIVQSPEPGKGGREVLQPDVSSSKKPYSVTVSFNTAYASELHNSTSWKPRKHSGVDVTGIGPFWLSLAASEYEKRLQKFASRIKEEMNRI